MAKTTNARTFWRFYNAASEQEQAFMRSGVSMADIIYLRTKGQS